MKINAPFLKPLLIFLTFIIIGCSTTVERTDSILINSNLDNYFSSLSGRGFSGAVLVEKNDTIVLQNGYGFANSEKEIMVSPKTVFNIASLGKQFTAAAILKLYADNQLAIQEPISNYISADWSENLKQTTIHQILTHTSGITEYYQPASLVFTNKDDFLQEVFKIQQSTGEQEFSYSNTGYELLAILIEEVSKMSYEMYLTETFFKPFKMDNTSFVGENKWNENLIAKGTGGVVNNFANQGITGYGSKGSGSVVSNIIDLYKWEKAIRNHKVLNEKMTELWFNRHITAEVEALFYAYGWRMNDTERNTNLLWHSGWDDAFSSIYYRLVDENTTIIFLSNYAVGLDPVRNVLFPALKSSELEKIIFNDSTLTETTGIELKDRNLNKLTGTYYLDQINFLKIKNKDDGRCLSIKPYGQKLVNLIFDYQDNERYAMDSITSKINTVLKELNQKNISTNEITQSLGVFDEYVYYDRGNEWVENQLNNIFTTNGTFDSIYIVGTAHSYGTRFNHTETNFDFVSKNATLNYSFINYSGEKYFVLNGANTFQLFICSSNKKDEFMLQDIMKRFTNKTFVFNEVDKELNIFNDNMEQILRLKRTDD